MLTSISMGISADKGQWKVDGSYSQGDVVTNHGDKFKCLVAGWCSGGNTAYEPGVAANEWAWTTAWEKVGDGPTPTPTDHKITSSVSITGDDLPTGATIELVDPSGNAHKIVNGKVNLEYADGGTTYSIKVNGAEGSVSPNTVTIDENSSNISLEYSQGAKPGPTPEPGKCDAIPDNVSEWTADKSSGYVNGDFVKYNDQIWENQKWWTSDTPGTSDFWTLCGEQSTASANVTVSGLPTDVDSFPITIDGKEYSVNPNSPEAIPLSVGSHEVKVASIASKDGQSQYIASKITPNPIEVTEETKDVQLNISFTKEEIPATTINLDLKVPADAKPRTQLYITIRNDNGFEDTQAVKEGSNAITVPSVGEYTLLADGYEVNNIKYSANPITVKDGKASTSTMTYKQNDLVFAGYMPVSWGSVNPTISQVADQGYNVAIAAFIKIDSGPVQFTDDHFLAYGGWNTPASDPSIIEDIKSDVAVAKAKNNLKYAIASVGGENNTFNPGTNADYDALADKTIEFLKTYGFDGIDFDLEQVPQGVNEDSIATFIEKLRDRMPNIIITAAPQVNNVNGNLEYVNTGTQQVYNKALAAGMFDYMFVQEYNTGGNFVDKEGNMCAAGSEGCYDETGAGFIENSFYSLKKITPANTMIVAGQPATAAAAGAATIFHGADEAQPYKAMCESYKTLDGQAQYGGAMTWDITNDASNNYEFAGMISKYLMVSLAKKHLKGFKKYFL